MPRIAPPVFGPFTKPWLIRCGCGCWMPSGCAPARPRTWRAGPAAADRLYYHLHQLEQAGLIEVTEYRELPGGKVERVYGIARVEPPGDEATPAELAAFLGQALDATRADINQAYSARTQSGQRLVTLTRSGARLSRTHFDELRSRFEELTRAAIDSPDDDGVWTRVLFT